MNIHMDSIKVSAHMTTVIFGKKLILKYAMDLGAKRILTRVIKMMTMVRQNLNMFRQPLSLTETLKVTLDQFKQTNRCMSTVTFLLTF